MGKRRHDRSAAVRAWITGLVVAGLAVGAVALTVTALRPAPAPTGVADYTPAPQPTAQYRPIVAFFGDSYSAGTGATKPSNRWTSVVSADLGWRENNFALGGTGYIATSSTNGCGKDYCPTYIEVIQALGSDSIKPDYVVISGGRNDGRSLPDQFPRIRETYAAAQALWPDARVIVTSPLWDSTAAPGWLTEGVATTRAAADELGALFLDLGQPLGGRPDLITADGVHPNDDGYAAVASTFIEKWNELATAP